MLLSEFELVFVNDEHGSEATTSISINLDLTFVDISYDRVFFGKLVALVTSSHLPNFSQ